MKRCAPPACWPQPNVSPLTITWSPSMIGDDMRPPCVVHMPNSSASERSHSSLPSLRQRHEQAVAAEREDVAGGRIDGRRRPGDAVRRHVAREQVVAVLPQQLAGVGVEAHQPFLHRRAGAGRCSAGRGGRRTRPAPSGRRTAPSRRGSRRPATMTSAGRSRSRRRSAPGRATPASPSRSRAAAAGTTGAGDSTSSEADRVFIGCLKNIESALTIGPQT